MKSEAPERWIAGPSANALSTADLFEERGPREVDSRTECERALMLARGMCAEAAAEAERARSQSRAVRRADRRVDIFLQRPSKNKLRVAARALARAGETGAYLYFCAAL